MWCSRQEVRPLQGQYPDWIFPRPSDLKRLEKMLNRASIPDTSKDFCLFREHILILFARVLPTGIEPVPPPSEGGIVIYSTTGALILHIVLSTGIEPVFPASQAGVLSIERREDSPLI